MNKTYRLIWSQHQQKLVAVGECTRGRGKGGGKAKTLVTAVAAALLSLSGSAQATCSAGPDTYTCSGAESATRSLSGTPLNLTLDPTFSMNVAAGNGLVLTGSNGLTVTQAASGGSLIAPGNAVQARNSGAGSNLQLTLTGNITGGRYGIVTSQSNFTGTTTIDTTAGAVVSTDSIRSAIYASTLQNAGGITITTANVTGAGTGIYVFHEGIDGISVNTTAGSVVGRRYDGIGTAVDTLSLTPPLSRPSPPPMSAAVGLGSMPTITAPAI